MPMLGQSSYARRGRPGRRAKHIKLVRTKVIKHRHRRWRGIHGAPKGTSARNRKKALALVKKRRAHRTSGAARSALLRKSSRAAALKKSRKRVFKGRKVKHGLKRHYKGRKVKKGLKRRFFGRAKLVHKRAFHGRKVRPGLKRRFFGRKPSTRPRISKIGSKSKAAIKAGAISPQSYINMF
jgi:hypothetical protein